MRVCECCGKSISEGHIVYPNSLEEFYLCVECFNKFYTEEIANSMYKEELQYYTEWSEEDVE